MTKELQCLKSIDITDSKSNETAELLFPENKSYLFIEMIDHTSEEDDDNDNKSPTLYPLLMNNKMKRILLTMNQKKKVKILDQNKLLINDKIYVIGSNELILNLSTNFYYVLKDIDDEEEKKNMKSDNNNNNSDDPRTWINNNDNEKKNEL